ncbi:S9 family peptidase [Sphingomonas baiyangensis]|uniref:S9 family peptidase n=1 Tax=Sphingomonas baiyangensis TaxID=2572576 RepID=A0A4U1L3D6_9SPHN|nr:S9 family peptidase [Sphingomonas baiyangensis]TKD50740.1 S9 family peptidase [Sphingomonas baiyangensis]
MRTWLAGLMLASTSIGAVASESVQRAASTPVADPAAIPLERLFGGVPLSGVGGFPPRLSPDGTMLTQLRARADEPQRLDLWAMDMTSGEWRMLLDSRKFTTGAELSEAEKMQRERLRIGGTQGVVRYDFAPDGRSILVPLDGDLYLATLSGDVRRLTQGGAGALNPVISPRGNYVSFVRDQNLFVMPATGGTAQAVTPDGKDTVHWGEAEFVADEEMHRRTGYWWSPDDTRIAVARYDEAPVAVLTRAAIGAEGTRLYEQRYPLAGTDNVLIDLYVMNPDGSGRTKVDLGENRDIYLARVDWSADGRTLLVQRQSRDQKTLDMLAVDPATGRSRVLFTEKAGERSWINLHDNLKPLKDGSLVWTSERDGFSHLYRFTGGNWRQLTRGSWNVAEVLAVDEGRGRVFLTGNKDGVLERHVYAVPLAGGEPQRLTEAGWWNEASMDAKASRLIVTRSNPSQPPQRYLADTAGTRTRWLSENRVDGSHPYAPFAASHVVPEFGTLKAADGSVLHYQMLSPRREPGRRYPVFFTYYGGPGPQTVTRGWTDPMHQMMVDRGWIVFRLDNRGSANRGRAFEDQIYHAMGTVEVEDQLLAANWLKQQPFVDGDRIGTFGWSYGGYMTLKLLEAAPGTFAAGVAGAPVSKWELYDTHYTERYMGDPRRVPQAYAASSTIGDAGKIADPLLVIHGMADDNVFLDNSTAMMAALQQQGVVFESMLYPGQTHAFGDPKLRLHYWKTMLDFYDRHVLAGD